MHQQHIFSSCFTIRTTVWPTQQLVPSTSMYSRTPREPADRVKANTKFCNSSHVQFNSFSTDFYYLRSCAYPQKHFSVYFHSKWSDMHSECFCFCCIPVKHRHGAFLSYSYVYDYFVRPKACCCPRAMLALLSNYFFDGLQYTPVSRKMLNIVI